MKKLVVCTAAVFLATAGISQAVTLTFNDEAAWRAAVGGVYGFENFDSTAAATDVFSRPALGLSLDPLNDGTQPTVQPYTSTGGVERSAPNNILNDRDFALPGRGPITVRPISGQDFIFGFGMWNVGGDDTLKLSFYDGAGTLIASVISAASSGFFGIVDDTGAKFAVMDFVGGNGYAPTDDWQAATRTTFVPGPAPIPLPAGGPLLLAAAIMLGGPRMLRKTRRA
jgi:hypothetical protein